MDKTITTLIFDWFGVCTKENWADCLAHELSGKLNVDELKVREVFKDQLHQFASNKIASDEFLENLIGGLSETVDPQDFKYIFSETIPNLNEPLLDYIKDLKSRYTTYLLSNNFGPVYSEYKKRVNFSDYFNELFLSHELGFSKNDSRIWEVILKKIDDDPKHIVFIDNKQKYFEPAKLYDVNTLWYQNNHQVIEDLRNLGIE